VRIPVKKQSGHARSQARSIAANLRVEGYCLTRKQVGTIADVIDGKRDAGREILEAKDALAARVQLRR